MVNPKSGTPDFGREAVPWLDQKIRVLAMTAGLRRKPYTSGSQHLFEQFAVS